MKLQGTNVVVVGMARSGVAAMELLLELGAHATAVDQNPEAANTLWEIKPQNEAAFAEAELIVLSPGVPADLPVLEPSRRRDIPIVGDLELASWFLEGPVIGITGSNGKTTTTALTGHILQASGVRAQVGGNIGTPPASLVKTSLADQWNVLELSSFQLETIGSFRANIGAILNITPDHLDRHYTFERYAQAKTRILQNQRPEDLAVLNAGDPAVRGVVNGETMWFSSTRAVKPGAWMEAGRIVLDGEPLMEAQEVPLRGRHNLENTMAAALIARRAGVAPEAIRAAVRSFPGVEHRLEFVIEDKGVAWYNDSKATNVDATLKAIDAFAGGLWVILGGKDKNSDFTPLAEPLRSKAHAALLIGAAAEKIRSQLPGSVRTIACGTIEEAVAQGQALARPGDTILLAPACASFDQFQNFEHRGREFKRLVRQIVVGEETDGAA